VRVVDPQGMSNSQRVDVTVTGFNDPPGPVPDSNSVVEDVVTTAVGNVLTNDSDVDHGSVLTVVLTVATPGATPGVHMGAYGTLTLNTDGSYEYQLDDRADSLAEGQVVHDAFEGVYGITDGAITNFATLLDIEITGTEDAVVPADGEVFEDGSRNDSGVITPQGIDLGTTLTWSVTGSGPMTPRADYRFLLDNLNIFRNGATFFNDDFGSGGPPPLAPVFGYGTFSTFLESGGRAIMDAGLGSPSTLPVPGAPTVIAHVATLITDTGPDLTQGLKREQDFRVEARYDLVIPDEARENYAVRFGDGANDIVEVCVRRMEDGSLAVALREVDVANTIPEVREAIPLAPAAGDNQIVLRLAHAANTDLVTASFDLLNGGVVTHTESFATAATIFSNEGWTRAQIIAQSVAAPQNGVYGTLSVEADGEWHYSLNNAAANVQALAQGEHVTDTFTVTVTDGHGMTDTQTVMVAVLGTDDTPVITSPSPTFQNGAYVVEDGQHRIATGQFIASDVDHGAVLSWSVTPGTLVPVGSGFQFVGYSSNYQFSLDQLAIERNGVAIFSDTFDDGNAPPSAPNFANGTPVNYLTNGAVFGESAGHLILDGANAGPSRGVGVPSLVAGHLATLASNIDPADLTRGLKSDDNFTVEARYDLAIPSETGQAYGVALSDNVTGGLPPDQLGDDVIGIEVARNNAGEVVVRYVERDVLADQFTTLESAPFAAAPGEDQIVLRLSHAVSQPGVVHASFDVYDDGLITRHVDFGAVGHIFGSDTPGYAGDDENWTRVQLQAFGLDQGGSTAQGTYGSVHIDPTGRWTYVLDNSAANVQALAQGSAFSDLFSVRVVDEYGVSTSRPLSIAVVGTGDGTPFPFTGVGGAGSDILVGSTLSDSLTGAGGSDLLVGLDGSDLFDYTALSDGVDTISDFTPGPGGDALDLHDLLIGYTLGSDPAAFVQLQQLNVTGLGLSTQVMVNADGLGTDSMPIAMLHGVSELSLADMIANDNLIL
jgi:VCBS repeat-containing protein